MPPKPSSSNWLNRIDRWIIFDPVRWPHRELISRGTALLLILGFLGLRIYQFDRFPQSFGDAHNFYAAFKTGAAQPIYTFGHIVFIWGIKLSVWIVELAIYLGYMVSYLSRTKAKNIAKGFMETAFPVIVAGIPILMAFTPYSLPRWAPLSAPSHLYFYLTIMALIVIGGMINLIGLLTLRRAFTIMSEAREMIMHGIFSRIRHPLYSGHFIMFFGSLLLRLHVISIVMYLLFCVGQVVRANIEERKLMQTFPEYKDYQKRTGMFFPRRLKR
ncbi:MAG: isoprenylcysteine carboxylmethyltransferase family protein [Desulfobacterales bacterium]|nr:isoprenylcysteine carboxylmethyltransferase family protein [Desulfobacterales bacterium]